MAAADHQLDLQRKNMRFREIERSIPGVLRACCRKAATEIGAVPFVDNQADLQHTDALIRTSRAI